MQINKKLQYQKREMKNCLKRKNFKKVSKREYFSEKKTNVKERISERNSQNWNFVEYFLFWNFFREKNLFKLLFRDRRLRRQYTPRYHPIPITFKKKRKRKTFTKKGKNEKEKKFLIKKFKTFQMLKKKKKEFSIF